MGNSGSSKKSHGRTNKGKLPEPSEAETDRKVAKAVSTISKGLQSNHPQYCTLQGIITHFSNSDVKTPSFALAGLTQDIVTTALVELQSSAPDKNVTEAASVVLDFFMWRTGDFWGGIPGLETGVYTDSGHSYEENFNYKGIPPPNHYPGYHGGEKGESSSSAGGRYDR